MSFSRKKIALATISFLALEFILIAYVDKPLSEYLRTLNPKLIDIFRDYTDLGKSGIYLWLSGVATIICISLARWGNFPAGRRENLWRISRTVGFFFLCVAVSGFISDFIKPLIGRARPLILDREHIYTFTPFTFHTASYQSMPSGHVTTAFAVAAALSLIWPRWNVPFFLFAFAIALSRIMVNAHFLSDVIAGALVGLLTVKLLHFLFERRGWMIGMKA